MTKNFASVLMITILVGASLSQNSLGSSINIQNTPNTTTSDTADLQNRRDDWCKYTSAYDRNYNASTEYYYRVIRYNFLGQRVGSVIDFFSGNSGSISFIQTIKWPFGCLLAIIIITFLTWIVFLIYLCAFKKQNKNDGFLGCCLGLSWVLIVIFFGVFIVFMVLLAHSEIAYKRSRCQLLNVGNMLVNGYVSQVNGNQYVGLTAQGQSVYNFQSDVNGVGKVLGNANNIISANYPAATANAINLLQAVAANYSSATTSSALGQIETPFSVKSLTEWVSPGAQQEFSNLNALGVTIDAAAQSVFGLVQNSGATAGPTNIATTVTVLNSFFANLTADVLAASNGAYYQVRDKYQLAQGSYWAIFAISIFIIPIAIFLTVKLAKIRSDSNEPRNFGTLKVLLAILGFLLVWYAVLTIILLAGSGVVATFCTILAQINQGNSNYVDSLSIRWPGNSKQVFKECTVGKTGNLWNFLSLRSDASTALFASNIQNIILGTTNYNQFYVNQQINSSSSIAIAKSFYASIQSGINFDYIGVTDQFNIAYNSWPFNSTNKIPSLTTFNCSALAASNFSSCLPIDKSSLSSFNVTSNGSPYANWTIVRNLQGYIQSEQALLNEISLNLLGRTDVLTPGQAFKNVKIALDVNKVDVTAITNQFKNTLNPFNQYQGQAIYTFDCRNIRKELHILEDHYCFELNYWVDTMVALASVCLIAFFILAWALCAAIRESDTEGEITNYPLPVEENKADINEREMIPQA